MNINDSIKAVVTKILRQSHITKPPVSLSKIAIQFGVKLTKAELDNNISGFLYREGEQSIVIAVNESHPITRQRFSTAHELGHLILGHEGKFFINRAAINFRNSLSGSGEDRLEKEANSFAAALLMPADFIGNDIGDVNLNLSDLGRIEELAKKYQVSVEAMTYRLTNLGLID